MSKYSLVYDLSTPPIRFFIGGFISEYLVVLGAVLMFLDACVEIYFPSFVTSLYLGKVSRVICLNSFFLNPCLCNLSKISEMNKLGRWLGKKKTERTDRVTRSANSPSAARVSYNEEIVPLELLEETSPARAMTFPCPTFM